MSKFDELTYFEQWEFDSPDEIGSGEKMSLTLLKKLDAMREEAGFSFSISSGYRTERHNEVVGGIEGSSHCFGLAVDVKCKDSRQRAIIVQLAFKYGITRIGISDNFIHLDIDSRKPQDVIWTY